MKRLQVSALMIDVRQTLSTILYDSGYKQEQVMLSLFLTTPNHLTTFDRVITASVELSAKHEWSNFTPN